MTELIIRDATPEDAAACAAIYAYYVRDTAITFELEPPPTTEDFATRIATAQARHAWLVATIDGVVIGYAYAGTYMERAAYRWSCLVSVYLEVARRRTGAGRALYEALFQRLTERGYRTVLGGITLPNEPSIGLHRALGFEQIGLYRRIGYKHGEWHDVAWLQKFLGPLDDEPPAEPV